MRGYCWHWTGDNNRGDVSRNSRIVARRACRLRGGLTVRRPTRRPMCTPWRAGSTAITCMRWRTTWGGSMCTGTAGVATNSGTQRSRCPPKAGLPSICWRRTAGCTSSALARIRARTTSITTYGGRGCAMPLVGLLVEAREGPALGPGNNGVPLLVA